MKIPAFKKIVCLGDSVTAGGFDEEGLGWVARLSQLLANNGGNTYYVVHNCGVFNNTSFDAWHSFNNNVNHIIPEILIIHVGTNDCQIKEREDISQSQSRYDFLEAKNRWPFILNAAKRNHYKTLVVSPLPIEQEEARYEPFIFNPPECKALVYRNQDILKYNDMLEEVSVAAGVPFLRVFEDWQERKNKEKLYADGCHPNAKGHQWLAEQVFAELQKLKYI